MFSIISASPVIAEHNAETKCDFCNFFLNIVEFHHLPFSKEKVQRVDNCLLKCLKCLKIFYFVYDCNSTPRVKSYSAVTKKNLHGDKNPVRGLMCFFNTRGRKMLLCLFTFCVKWKLPVIVRLFIFV